MKRMLKIILILFFVIFALMQFFRIDRTNPPIDVAATIDKAVPVTPDVKILLARSCNDCHSNLTRYPWYSHIQPAAWFLRDHIDTGRSELNFSEFASYSPDKQRHKLEEICDEVRSGRMPLASYTWLHREAVLAPSERQAICAWTQTVLAESDQ